MTASDDPASGAPPPAPLPSPSKRSAAVVTALLLVAAAVGGYALYRRSSTPPPRPVAGDLLVEGAVDVPAAGAARRFRVKKPCQVEVRVDLPAGTAVRVSFGVPGPVEASPGDGPDAAAAVRWTVKAGDAPHTEVVDAPGLYVLRLEPEAAVAVRGVALTVRTLPAR